jgi:hypothetical protein
MIFCSFGIWTICLNCSITLSHFWMRSSLIKSPLLSPENYLILMISFRISRNILYILELSQAFGNELQTAFYMGHILRLHQHLRFLQQRRNELDVHLAELLTRVAHGKCIQDYWWLI